MGIREKIMDIFFPSGIYCISCGNLIDGSRMYALCDSCIRRIHWAGDRTCEKCGKILEDSYRHSLCYDCRSHERSFDKGFTCVQYGLLERGILMDYKYRGKSYIGRKLADILYDRMQAEDIAFDLIVPVPMYVKNQNRRGYNQAQIMAAGFARRKNMVCASELLERTRKTVPMKGLGVVERFENLKNVFAVSSKNHYTISGKTVLLIDDIFTTGSTLEACSSVLKNAGADKVYVLTFACGGNIAPKN